VVKIRKGIAKQIASAYWNIFRKCFRRRPPNDEDPTGLPTFPLTESLSLQGPDKWGLKQTKNSIIDNQIIAMTHQKQENSNAPSGHPVCRNT